MDPSHIPSKAPGLLWLGSYEEATGLADEIRGFLRALEARGHAPAIRHFLKPRHAVELSPAAWRPSALLSGQSGSAVMRPAYIVALGSLTAFWVTVHGVTHSFIYFQV